MAYVDLIGSIHRSTPRDYLKERVIGVDKAACAQVAKRFDKDYWDGDRKYGYGGYRYDGRWKKFAQDLVNRYGLKSGHKVLDIGCGKGFLLHDLAQCVPGLEITGIDISRYAVENAKEEVKKFLTVGSAVKLPYPGRTFDLIVSINTLHNLFNFDLDQALKEIERVGKNNKKYIVVDSYRNEKEKVNLMYWQLTCQCFYTPEEWQWFLDRSGYNGDFGCIYNE